MNRETMVIDSHQHFWDPGRLHYGWMPPQPHILNRSYLPRDLEPHLRRNRVDGTVLVQAISSLEETAYLLEIARANDFIVGVVAWVDLKAPDVGGVLDRLSHEPKLVGIRHQVEMEAEDHWLLRDDVIRGLTEVAAHGLAFDLLVQPHHLPLVTQVAEKVPGLRLVIDHLAKPAIAAREFESWAGFMTDAARSAPKVYCKISGMATQASHAHWTQEELRPYLQHLVEVFGLGRLMWGSDWPVCLMAATYEQAFHAATDFLGEAPETLQAKYLGMNAVDFYRLKLPAMG